jgi:transcriptional regulator with XRE-family HTH domain
MELPLTDQFSLRPSDVHYTGHLGQRIRSLREEQRMSIRRLAKSAGMSQETLRQLETDPQANPRLDTLLRLQQALGLASLEQLLGGFARFPTGALAEERNPQDEASSA